MDFYVDARTMASKPSGVGIYLYHLLKQLTKYGDLQITLLTDVIESDEIKYFQNRKIAVIAYGERIYKSAAVIKYFRFIQNVLINNQPQMFWEPNNIIPIKIKGYRGNIMLTIHDLFPITSASYFGMIYRIYFRNGIKRGIKQADKIIYDSKETMRYSEKYFTDITRKENFVSYIPMPKLEEEIIEDEQYFLYIGNMEKRKGVDLLLKSYLAYRLQGGEKKLYLAGKMREREVESLMVETQGKIDGIKYYGYITPEEKRKLLSRCSCFVFPSKAEGFGIPPIEAMNYGKPLILSELSIFKEIIGESANYFGLDAKEEEQIENLKKALENYKEGSAEKYARVMEKYAPEKIGRELHKFITKL